MQRSSEGHGALVPRLARLAVLVRRLVHVLALLERNCGHMELCQRRPVSAARVSISAVRVSISAKPVNISATSSTKIHQTL